MAVLTAVLTPALLTYVEISRAQKDDSAMGEVTNAIQLALADQEIYDEMLMCAEDGVTTLEFINENQSYVINNTEITTADTSVTTADTLGGVKRSGEFATEGEEVGQLANRLNNIIGTTVSLTSRTHRTDNYVVTIGFGSNADDYAVSVTGDWKTTGAGSGGSQSGGGSVPLTEYEITIAFQNNYHGESCYGIEIYDYYVSTNTYDRSRMIGTISGGNGSITVTTTSDTITVITGGACFVDGSVTSTGGAATSGEARDRVLGAFESHTTGESFYITITGDGAVTFTGFDYDD